MREVADVALGAMASKKIELSPHCEDLAIFLYGFDHQMMG